MSDRQPLSVGLANHNGHFITFEGQDGSGKTIQAALLADRLRSLGQQVTTTREPGGTPLGQTIRGILLDPETDIDPYTEALLFAADRAQHIRRLVLPALNAGHTVIQDRYIDSSVAYQGAGRSLEPTDIRHLSMWAANGLVPDLTVLIDLDPAVCRDRAIARAQAAGGPQVLDRMEAEDMPFRHRLRDGFLEIAAANSDRFAVIDGDQPPLKVAETINRVVAAHFRHRP